MTDSTRHGLSIGIERVGRSSYLTLKARGRLSHEDYELLRPLLESALEGLGERRMKVLFDATELEGWELRAAWDDLKLGLKHGGKFDKVALYGNRNWQQIASKLGSWFISGEVRYFEDRQAALEWLDG